MQHTANELRVKLLEERHKAASLRGEASTFMNRVLRNCQFGVSTDEMLYDLDSIEKLCVEAEQRSAKAIKIARELVLLYQKGKN